LLRQALSDRQWHRVHRLADVVAYTVAPHVAKRRYEYVNSHRPELLKREIGIQVVYGRRYVVSNTLRRMKDVEQRGRGRTREARLLPAEDGSD